jgi:hypothetical protein
MDGMINCQDQAWHAASEWKGPADRIQKAK